MKRIYCYAPSLNEKPPIPTMVEGSRRIEVKKAGGHGIVSTITTEIHPEDWARAVVTKTGLDKKIQEEWILDSAVNTDGSWSHQQKAYLASRICDADFMERLSRGRANRKRKSSLSETEQFVLEAWRGIEIAGKEFPGLREWGPKAATTLLQFCSVEDEDEMGFEGAIGFNGGYASGSYDAYKKLVSRVGLERKAILISGFRVGSARTQKLTGFRLELKSRAGIAFQFVGRQWVECPV